MASGNLRRFALTAAFMALALMGGLACQEVEEDIPGRAALLTPETSPAPSPAPSPSPSPAPADLPPPAERPAILTMEGPTQARPGDILTYRLTYTRGTGVIIAIPRPIEYISSRLAAGRGDVTKEPGEPAGTIDLRWTFIGEGQLEIIVQVPEDMTSGTFVMGASGPGGSGIPASEQVSSNLVHTTVVAP